MGEASAELGESPGLLELVERGVLACTSAATLAAALLVARSDLPPFQAPASFGLVFWMWFFVLYLTMGLPVLLLVWRVSRMEASWRPSIRAVPRWALGLTTTTFVAVVLGLNQRALPSLLTLGDPARFRWLLPTAVVASVLGLLATGLLPPARRSPGRLLVLGAAASFAAALLPATPVLPEPPLLAGALTRERFLLVGVDGADWRFVDALVARGELPVLAELKARGAWGHLATLQPTRSPEIWTTIFTGWPPWRHGIIGFTRPRIRGVDNVLPRLRRQRGTGLELLREQLLRFEVIHEVPVNSDMRRFPAYWNISSAYATAVNVVGIEPTWPAEQITGNLVSERVVLWPQGRRKLPPDRLTYPESLYDEISHLVLRIEDLDPKLAMQYMDVDAEQLAELRSRPQSGLWNTVHKWDRFLARHLTVRGIVDHLLKKKLGRDGRPSDTLLWLDLIDKLCHTALRCSELVPPGFCSEEDRARLSRVVSAAYRRVDATLGEIVAAFGEGNVIVVSDHGWARDWHPETPPFTHREAPAGVFLASGPAFRHAQVEGLTVYDLLPLLLRLKGFALADDLRGRVPEPAFEPAFLASNPVVRIASYGRRGVSPAVSSAEAGDDRIMEQLRGLGYIQ